VIPLEECFLCDWLVSGNKIREFWCGAGRPEFLENGQKVCPSRLPKSKIEIYFNEHPELVEMVYPGSLGLSKEVQQWIVVNKTDRVVLYTPDSTYEYRSKLPTSHNH